MGVGHRGKSWDPQFQWGQMGEAEVTAPPPHAPCGGGRPRGFPGKGRGMWVLWGPCAPPYLNPLPLSEHLQHHKGIWLGLGVWVQQVLAGHTELDPGGAQCHWLGLDGICHGAWRAWGEGEREHMRQLEGEREEM